MYYVDVSESNGLDLRMAVLEVGVWNAALDLAHGRGCDDSDALNGHDVEAGDRNIHSRCAVG